MSFVNPFSEVVARGARELDEYKPGWYKLINTDALDMESQEFCIMGQLFEFYGSNESYDFRELMSERYGFMGRDLGLDLPWAQANPDNWALLEIAWIHEINARLELTSI